jgi:hypothetical protein
MQLRAAGVELQGWLYFQWETTLLPARIAEYVVAARNGAPA